MSDPLMDLVVRLSSGTRNSNNAKLGERFAEVRDYILGLEKIRIFIADSINYGHQSSSVNIMRSFIRWGSNAKFTLLLYGNIASLEPKIKLLIPQFSKLDEDFTLDGRTIKAIKLDDTTVLPKLPFGITGGFDDKEVGTPPPLTLINVSNFVELQPYAWNRGTNMIFAEDQKGWQSINLDTLDSLQIQKRAFYLPDPQVTESDWAAILGSEYAEKAKIVRFLVDKATAGNIHLCPIYGITRKFAPYSSLYNAVSGMLSGADRYPQAKRPIVALVIAEMQLDDQIQFNTYIRNPSNKLRPPTIKPSEDFLTWHAANNVKARVNPEGALTLSELEVDLKEVKSGNVLVVGLGRIPAVLFDYLYLRATLPPMLEGQNTAELMLNIGKPYLKLGSNVSEIAFGYPSLPLTSKPKGKDAKTSQEIAFRGLYDAPPDNWYESRSTFPPRILLKMIFAYVGGSAANPLTRYFNNLRSFYHDPVNDKLLRAMDILVNSVLPKPAVVSVSGLSLGEEGPIPKLYKELNDNLHNGVLNLLQVITSGLIYDYFKEIVTDSAFTLTNATVTINDDQSEVTVTGKSAALGVRSPDLKINFTMANEDSYAATVTMAIDSAWDLSGGQWLSLSNPSMQLRIDPVAAVPVMGAVAVKVRAGFTMNMSIVLPAESGIAVFQSTFTDPKPSITNIFQIVGGINLQNILPSQLQLFSDIEVQDFSIRYNYDDKQIDSIGVILGTPEEKTWKVVPSVEITKITLQATISSPANMAERETAYQIGGSFSINKSEAYVDASLPQLSISGGLREGSQPLHVASIIETYLGKDFVKALPDVITKAEIDILTFSLDRAAGTYSFGMHVRTSWPITIDQKTLFTIEELGLYISATSSEIDTTEQKQDTNGAALADKTTDITGKFNGVITILPDSANIGLSISASYDGPDAGWTFDTSTTTAIKVAQLLKDYGNFDPGSQNDYSIDSLALTITTGDNSWVFVGTVSNWKVDFLDLPAIKRASVKLGYNGEKANLLYHPAIVGSTALLILTEQEDEKGYFAEIEADIEWLGVEITTWIKFSSQSKPSWGLTWSKLQATVQQDPEQDNDWIGSIKFKEDTTLGSMVEAMVSWATGSKFGLSAPWDILSSISLNGLVLIYNFTKKTVRFSINIGPIELGFARIDSIGIAYQSDQPKPEDNGVKVTLEGSFLWLTKPDEPLSWDASKPETTPAPPGDGNKYLDLRLLAMGQHVTVKDITKADTIQKAIGLMRDMPDPKPGELPTVDFDPASSWLIGADFGVLKLESKKNGANGPLVSSDGERSVLAPSDVSLIVPSNASKGLGYFLTAQFVFNDPHLYGLRLALDGEPAKIFKGLDFQIMYRQVSETVGVYQAEITLPDVMRRLDVGAYTITLPVFGIAVYTNGDFMLDIGFPWNQDFTRSFSIEAIIYPGIPVVGSAGLYFGKLSSASTNKVPPAVNGTFNPVIVFGFGMQVGFGKSIEAGILKAGFSLTIVGILEGVIGKWNPYQLIDSSQDNTQLQGSYYFWLQGTLGIIGKLYGSIDFAIIKADVNLTIKLLIQLTYESFVSLALTVIVSVDVSVNIEINLGLFTIKIHFSFSLLLKESFTIDNHGEPPWKVAATKDKSVLHAPADHRLSFHRRRGRRLQALGAEGPINWSNLKAPAQPADLSGYLAPALTVARDEWSTSEDPKDQLPCYVTMLFIDSAPPSTEDSKTSALKAAGALPDTPFEALCKMVLRWAIAAIQDGPRTIREIDELVIGDLELLNLAELLNSTDDNPTPIPGSAIESFLFDQFRLTITVPGKSKGAGDAAYFPVPPQVKLEIPSYGDHYAGYNYRFAEYNSISDSGLKAFRVYFDRLAVQLQREVQKPSAALAEKTLSMAGWIQADYFLLIARQMVQAARSALRDFKYPIEDGQKTNQIVHWINDTAKLTGADAYTLAALFSANPNHPLNKDKTLTIGVTYPIDPDLAPSASFSEIAENLGNTFAATDLAAVNSANDQILAVGAIITYRDRPPYPVTPGDSLISVAKHFGVTLNDIWIGSDALTKKGLLKPTATLVIPYFMVQALVNDTFEKIASASVYKGGFSAKQLAALNAGRSVLRQDATITYPDKQPCKVQARDCLGDIANRFEVSLSDLLDKSDLLQQADLFAPVALLALPPFPYLTVAGDTLRGIASHFATAIGVLGAETANGDFSDLFSKATAENQPTPYLDVPHLARFKVAELIAEAQRSLALQNLSGMTSRYYLHGLRLPTVDDQNRPIITPLKEGMWVKPGSPMTLPPKAGLFALTGQQIPLPEIQKPDNFKITFDRSDGPNWLLFNESQKPTDKLTIEIAPVSDDNTRIQKVIKYAQGNRLDMGLTQLGSDQMSESELVTYPLTSQLVWQSATAVVLPYGKTPSGIPSVRLWPLPEAIVSLPDPMTRKINPRFSLKVGRYDEATGGTVQTFVGYYGWSSTINFKVKKIPAIPSSPATAATYEISGADGNDIVLMERLLAEVGADEAFIDQVIIGYSPNQTGDATQGVQTDAPDAVTLGIAQVNLSTETRPAAAAARDFSAVVGATQGFLNTKIEFIRLLWEASITNSGGFFLYYYNSTSKTGFPDRIFNDQSEASLTLIVLYAKPPVEADQNRLTDFMNAVAIGDAIDTSNALIFAQASPPSDPATEIEAAEDTKLATLGYQYYTDVADVAQANATRSLASGVKLQVTEGVYEVGPAGGEPGGDLEQVARYFGTSAQAIKDANPRRTDWPNPLPTFTALRLPPLEVTVGTSPGGTTLGDIATYYGENLTALAARNANVPGLFALGQKITLLGGPRLRRATVPAGVQALAASRLAILQVPDLSSEHYARDFLLQTFSLLNYQVAGNVDFNSSGIGLPAGPINPQNEENHFDKVRTPRVPTDGDAWEYKQSFPYPGFVKASAPHLTDLPDATHNPYRAIGKLLQVAFEWQDFYGNTLVTTLSSPAIADKGPLNQPPILTGYTDALVGLGQWPSISTDWAVITAGNQPALQLRMNFDVSRYQGLLRAQATSATQILATFTEELEPDSARDRNNYKLDNEVVIDSVEPSLDGKSVTLTVSNLSQSTLYTLSVDLKRKASDQKVQGRGSFSFPDQEDLAKSTVQENAFNDLHIYTQLYYQLTDANGIDYMLESTLLKSSDGGAGAVALSPAQVDDLKKWLFEGSGPSSSIYSFLSDRANFRSAVLPPPAQNVVLCLLKTDQLNDSQIFDLSLSFTIRRTGGTVFGDLQTTPEIQRASTPVAPLTGKIDTASGDTLGLNEFAKSFETALSVPGKYIKTVATGINRARFSTVHGGRATWAIRLGETPAEAISYTPRRRDPDHPYPAIFAPRPISNKLESSQGQVPIFGYTTGSGLSSTPTKYLEFTQIDLDVWGRQFLGAIDNVLSPEFTAAVQLVSKKQNHFSPRNFLTQILAQKKALAEIVKLWMMPVFDKEEPDPKPVQAAFYQQLLQRLGNAYTTRAAITAQSDVNADVIDPLATESPRLFGEITIIDAPSFRDAPGDPTSGIDLTSPKLPLHTFTNQAFGFLLSSPALITGATGEVLKAIDLNLRYDATTLEHQISSVAPIEGDYKASSWLGFVTNTGNAYLHKDLGLFTVPLVVRAYPNTPTMAAQDGKPTNPATNELSLLTFWNYTFTYALPFHYPQDRIHCEVDFNVATPAAAFTGLENAFNQLAQFVTVFPDVNKDLLGILAKIDATTVDQTAIDNSAIALDAFLKMVRAVTAVGANAALFAPHREKLITSTLVKPYKFAIGEGTASIDNKEALLVTIYGKPPDSGIGAPKVFVDPDNYEIQLYSGQCAGDYCYWYKGKDGKPLSAVDGQKIANRQVLLPGMDIFQRQDAWSTVYVKRNEDLVPGKQIADVFVYTTPNVQFANPQLPTIDSDAVVDIGSIGTPPPPRSLQETFAALFGELLKAVAAEQLVIQVEVSYEYTVNKQLSSIPLPVFMQPPLTVTVKEPGVGTLQEMYIDWSDAIEAWFKAYQPEPAELKNPGTLWFDLTIMSNLTAQPMPLLRLRQLKLPLLSIKPSLVAVSVLGAAYG